MESVARGDQSLPGPTKPSHRSCRCCVHRAWCAGGDTTAGATERGISLHQDVPTVVRHCLLLSDFRSGTQFSDAPRLEWAVSGWAVLLTLE